MNIGCMCPSDIVFSGCMPRCEIIGAYGNSKFNSFEEPPYFSLRRTMEPIFIPTYRIGRFLFLSTFSSIYVCRLFDDGHSDWYEVIPHCSFVLFCFVCIFVVLGLHLWCMACPRLGVKSELLLLAYARAKAMPDPSRVCDVHHSSQQC